MKNLRKYGKAPFKVAAIHGGPGAGGEMAPVARELSSIRGVLEPLQTADSLEGQVEELRTVLQENSDFPVTLIGYSWGAWLGFIVAAYDPSLVGKLILVGSGPFEEKYAEGIQEKRLSRLNEGEKKIEYKSIISILGDPEATTAKEKDAFFARLGALTSKTDAYDPDRGDSGNSVDPAELTGVRSDIFQKVWKDAVELRRSGRLMGLAKSIRCPVVAIHGDYDPHPAEGVEKPLAAVLKDFRFILLKNCGHKPWVERQAKNDFYIIIREEL